MIPKNYVEWLKCIEDDCNIKLTVTFARQRLEVLENKIHPETIKFKRFYGENHLSNITSWFRQVTKSANN